MARSRREQNTESNTQTGGVATMSAFETLDQNEINEILASGRQRGEYARHLRNFLESGQLGWKIPLTEGPFEGRNKQTVKTGFSTAADNIANGKVEGVSDELKAAARNLRIQAHEENVYLIRQDMEAAEAA